MERCHVCGNPTTEGRAYARIALRDSVYLICCPMCLTAIQAGAVQRRMVSPSREMSRASAFVQYLPAVQVGGDYAWIHPSDEDHLYVVVADVSGHGITSSLVASRIASEVERTVLREGPAGLAERLNRLMWSTFAEERVYLTLFCAAVDFGDRALEYVNCGHPPALLWSARSRSGGEPLPRLPNEARGPPGGRPADGPRRPPRLKIGAGDLVRSHCICMRGPAREWDVTERGFQVPAVAGPTQGGV